MDLALNDLEWLICHKTKPNQTQPITLCACVCECVCTFVCVCEYIYIYIYAPPWGLSTLAKELPVAASVMQSSSKELSTLVADRVLKKCKQRLLLLFLKIKIP